MKDEEKFARKFLMERFGQEPIYEPCGPYSPPDFALGRTAFEVRRLNQRFFAPDGSIEGLEQVEHQLLRAVTKALARISFTDEGGTFFWMVNFRRPLAAEAKTIAKQLAQAAREYYRGGSRKSKAIEKLGVTLSLIPATTPRATAFFRVLVSDDDSPGFVSDIYPKHVRLALKEKIEKTRKIVEKFDHWVLILVDYILWSAVPADDMGPFDLDLAHFNSLVIINPVDGSLGREYPDGSLRGCEPTL
jgi:hypothetical protein